MLTTQEREYLLSSMKDLFDEYGYNYTSTALNQIIDEWFEAKSQLIQAFKKHPNYLEGEFMITFDTDYEREVNKQGSIDFSSYLLDVCCRGNDFVSNLPKEVDDERIADGCAWLPNDIWVFLNDLKNIATRTVREETVQRINEIMPKVHAHTGEKTSRVINKICTYLGYNKLEGYNKEFAKYADSLSPLKIKRHTILSINPLDYLTMSFGNSWSSCHTIDKNNKRRMPNGYQGQYSSGTISYMLDGTSMVFYTVDASYNGQIYWNEPKINRQMFHYGEEKLIQSRLYPQSNDGCGEDYTPNRNIVQNIIADIYDFPNLWSVKKGSESSGKYVETEGTHYPDYNYFSDCTLSRHQGSVNNETIIVGRTPICIECGCTHDNGENINCCTGNYEVCAACGCIIDDYDRVHIDGEIYCRDCVNYCDLCDEYHLGESYYIERDDISVCGYCRDEYYYSCSDCGEYVHEEDVYYVDYADDHICPECYEEHYRTCSQCGEIFRTDDVKYIGGDPYCENCYEYVAENDDEEAC